MKTQRSVMKLLVAILWCVVSVGCTADGPFVEAWSSEKPKAVIDNSKQIPVGDLYWKRPASSFVMVESKNDTVCNEFLNAISEERDHAAMGDVDRSKGIKNNKRIIGDRPRFFGANFCIRT